MVMIADAANSCSRCHPSTSQVHRLIVQIRDTMQWLIRYQIKIGAWIVCLALGT